MPAKHPHFLIKCIFEVRYADGELYWDLSGKVRRALVRDENGWAFNPRPEQEHWNGYLDIGTLGWAGALTDDRIRLAFGAKKTDLSVELPRRVAYRDELLERCAGKMARTVQVVMQALSIGHVTRIGYRLWVLVENLKVSQVLPDNVAVLIRSTEPTPLLGATVTRLHRVGDAKARVSLSDGAVTLKGVADTAGLLIDVDFSRENPLDANEALFQSHIAKGGEVFHEVVTEALRRGET